MNDVFWIIGNPAAPLAIVLRPQPDRFLRNDLLRMKQEGIETLVSLLEEDEAEMLGLGEEGRIAEQIGLHFLSFPIADRNTPPNMQDFRSFVSGLADRLRDGEKIGVHCRGSIGRSTVTAACALIHLGWLPDAALAAIEAARGLCVPDTEEQETWILKYKPQP
jgi:protein-tyrosine phosphatase